MLPTKFYHVTQIKQQMCPKFGNSRISMREFDQKNHFFDNWFKFNNQGLVIAMALKFYSNVTKGLKLKV